MSRESGPPEPPKPRLLDRVRHAIETRHYSRRTEKAYIHWIKRYIFFYGNRHPAEMGAAEVAAFLTSLAVQRKVAASTQNQALSALLFLYREVLGIDLPWLDDVVRAKRPPASARRADARGGPCRPPAPRWRPAAHGDPAVWRRGCGCWNAVAYG